MLFTVAGGADNVGIDNGCSSGTGFTGDGGAPTSATLLCPQGVWWQANNGNPYLVIGDSNNHRVRVVNLASTTQTIFNQSIAANTIKTVAGTGTNACTTSGVATSASLDQPISVTVDSVFLYWADAGGAACPYFMKVSSAGTLSIFAGNGTQGYLYGACTASEFYQPMDIKFDNNHVAYLVDQLGATVSMAKNGVCSNLAGNYALYGNRGGYGPVGTPARFTAFEGAFNGGAAGPLGATPEVPMAMMSSSRSRKTPRRSRL